MVRISSEDIGLLILYCIFMTTGQVAFKYVSLSLSHPISLSEAAARLPFNPLFWLTGLLYFVSTIYWTWLLTKIPLAIAYPVVSLTLVIVPVLAWAIFSETLTLINLLGIVFIIGGISLVVR